jgi:hypothetical protein
MIARFLTLALLAMLAGCGALRNGGGLIGGGGDGTSTGTVKCHGARCE